MNPLFDAISWDRDGGGIEAESFRRIEAEVDPAMRVRFSDAEWRVPGGWCISPPTFRFCPSWNSPGSRARRGGRRCGAGP